MTSTFSYHPIDIGEESPFNITRIYVEYSIV